MSTTATVLVTASTGTIGRLLVPALQQRGIAVRRFDRSRPIAPQLDGVDALFLACPNVPDQVAYECALIDAAAAAGTDRLVKLSARGVALGSPVAYWDWHARIEQHLADSGVPAIALRPGFSMANLLGAVAEHGVLAVPAGDARVAMVDPADVAEAAAAALTQDAPSGSYELTGSAAIGFTEVAAACTALAGREVRYVDVPPEQAVPAMVGAGLPPFVAQQIAAVFAALRGGAQAEVTDDLQRLIGRSGGGVRRYLQRVGSENPSHVAEAPA